MSLFLLYPASNHTPFSNHVAVRLSVSVVHSLVRVGLHFLCPVPTELCFTLNSEREGIDLRLIHSDTERRYNVLLAA